MDIKPYWDEYYKPLLWYAMSKVYRRDVAEDIVQECFIKLLTAEDRGSLKSFLFVCCRNACTDYIRGVAIHDRLHKQLPEPGDVEDYDMMYAWYLHELAKASQQLSPSERRVMRLVLQGDTCAEIARKFGVNAQTTRNLKTKAIHHLQELLGTKKPGY